MRKNLNSRHVPIQITWPTLYKKKQHTDGPLLQDLHNPQYKILILKTFQINITSSDNYISTKLKQIVKIKNICYDKSGGIVIVGNSFSNKRPYYNKPIDSTKIGIYVVDDLSPEYEYWSIHDIVCKYMILEIQDQKIGFPIIHTSSNKFL